MKFFAVLILSLLPACLHAQSTSAIPLNGIVARVNDTVITFKDVLTAMSSELEFLESHYGNNPAVFDQRARELRENAVRDLVERQLILHEFKTGGYSLPESYIDDQIDREIRNNYGSRLTLTKTLQAQGLTFEHYRQRMREKVILSAMVRQFIPPNPVISPFKIETYYKENQDKFKLEDQVKLRMIVITNQVDGDLSSTKALAQEIVAKLDEGAEFGEMAKVYSQDSRSADGGDWGWVERSVLREDLSEIAFGLKAGQRSALIERPHGCYLMLVEEVKQAHTRPLSEVRGEIEKTLKDQETKRLHDKWIERLKTKSFVQYFPD